MTNSELNNYLTLEETQQGIKAQYERNQVQLDVLRKKALQFLKSSVSTDEAIFELDGKFYRLWIDPDDDIQVGLIQKIA